MRSALGVRPSGRCTVECSWLRRVECGFPGGWKCGNRSAGPIRRRQMQGAGPLARRIYGVGELTIVVVAVAVAVGGSPRISKTVETCQVVPMKI